MHNRSRPGGQNGDPDLHLLVGSDILGGSAKVEKGNPDDRTVLCESLPHSFRRTTGRLTARPGIQLKQWIASPAEKRQPM